MPGVQRMEFDVTGTTATEVDEAAKRVLGCYRSDMPGVVTAEYDIDVRPEVIATNGSVVMWVGHVSARLSW